MRQFMMTVMALAAFGAMVAAAQAENNPSRTARTAEPASTCSALKLACLGLVVRGTRYYRVGRCVYLENFIPAPEANCEKQCNFIWENCMKTGFWEGRFIHRPAERR